jgi:hypothetical protein
VRYSIRIITIIDFYHWDKLDEELPPMVENLVKEGITSGDVFVIFEVF